MDCEEVSCKEDSYTFVVGLSESSLYTTSSGMPTLWP